MGWASWQYLVVRIVIRIDPAPQLHDVRRVPAEAERIGYPGWTANATGWDSRAWNATPRVNVDQTPIVGSIAQWNSGVGHVAYVEAVTASFIEITSDNWGGGTNRLRIDRTSPTWPDNFIHFADLGSRPVEPSATSLGRNADGRLELWGVNTNIPDTQGNIFHRWQLSPGGGWSNWEVVPGYLTSVAVATNADGRLEVWGVNTHIPDGNNNVFEKHQLWPGGSWSAWQGMSGYLTTLGLARNRDGRLELFGANSHIPDSSSNVFQRWQLAPNSGWSGWNAVAGYLTGVAVATNQDGRLELFGVNTHIPDGNNNVFQKWQLSPGGGWSGWLSVGGYLTALAAGTNKDGRLELFGVNSHIPQTQAGRDGTRCPDTSPLAVSTNRDGRLEIFGANTHIPTTVNNVFQRW